MRLENFILICYDHKPDHFRASMQLPFCRLMVHQIRRHYPNSKIHIIANRQFTVNAERIYFHVDEDLPHTHMAKFHIYDLLDEPAMYLDTDIILVKPFPEEALETDGPFNLYHKYESKKLNFTGWGITTLYNAGIVWVQEPSTKIVDKLMEIHQTHFSEPEIMKLNNLRLYVDEHSIAIYIKSHGLNMKLLNYVNKPRGEIRGIQSIGQFQSVHYMHPDRKLAMMSEYDFLNRIRML